MKKLILLIMVTLVGTAYSATTSDSNNQILKYNIENIEKISLDINNASIKVIPTDSSEIVLNIKTNKKINVTKEGSKNKIDIKVTTPKKFLFFNFSSNKISVVLEVPRNYHGELNVETSNAPINIADLDLNFEGETSNSKINASNHTGSLDLESSNGGIYLVNIIGNVEAETSNATITADKVEGSVNFETSNGNIYIKNIDSVEELKTSNGNITVVAKKLYRNSNIKASNGNIDLKIEELKGNNSIQTSNGSIVLTTGENQTNFQNISNNELEDRDNKIKLKTSNGKINTHIIK